MLVLPVLAGTAACRADTVSGCYKGPVYVASGLDGVAQSRTPTANELTLRLTDADTLEFGIQLVSDWGHVCTAHEHAVHLPGREPLTFVFSVDAKPEAQRDTCESHYACQLRMQILPHQILVEAVGGECDAYFGCGARTSLSKVLFVRDTRVLPDQACCRMPRE